MKLLYLTVFLQIWTVETAHKPVLKDDIMFEKNVKGYLHELSKDPGIKNDYKKYNYVTPQKGKPQLRSSANGYDDYDFVLPDSSLITKFGLKDKMDQEERDRRNQHLKIHNHDRRTSNIENHRFDKNPQRDDVLYLKKLYNNEFLSHTSDSATKFEGSENFHQNDNLKVKGLDMDIDVRLG